MRKIIIKLPDDKVKKFRLQSVDWKGGRYLTAVGLLNTLRRRFGTQQFKEKTCVSVKDGRIYQNESYPSNNPLEQLYAASCFLEEYLSRTTMRQIEKEYFKHNG